MGLSRGTKPRFAPTSILCPNSQAIRFLGLIGRTGLFTFPSLHHNNGYQCHFEATLIHLHPQQQH
jgi:hypothetical protein